MPITHAVHAADVLAEATLLYPPTPHAVHSGFGRRLLYEPKRQEVTHGLQAKGVEYCSW